MYKKHMNVEDKCTLLLLYVIMHGFSNMTDDTHGHRIRLDIESMTSNLKSYRKEYIYFFQNDNVYREMMMRISCIQNDRIRDMDLYRG